MYREEEILEWARERGILDAKNADTQALYMFAEIQEYRYHCSLEYSHKIAFEELCDQLKDDIGDTYVTLVSVANLIGTELDDCMDGIDMPELQLDYVLMEFADAILKRKDQSKWVGKMIRQLKLMANGIDCPLNDCIDVALDGPKGILNRTGKNVDGAFVKDPQ